MTLPAQTPLGQALAAIIAILIAALAEHAAEHPVLAPGLRATIRQLEGIARRFDAMVAEWQSATLRPRRRRNRPRIPMATPAPPWRRCARARHLRGRRPFATAGPRAPPNGPTWPSHAPRPPALPPDPSGREPPARTPHSSSSATSSSRSSTSASCAPAIACRPPSTKHGTPLIPRRCARRFSA